jgi:hypothetical protein
MHDVTRDDIVLVCFTQDEGGRINVHLEIITSETRSAALAMVPHWMQPIVHGCALNAAYTITRIKCAFQPEQDRLEAYRRYHKKNTGIAFPPMTHVHRVMSLDVQEVYADIAMEFLPRV